MVAYDEYEPGPRARFFMVKIDELVRSHISDGFEKRSRSRLENPEEGGVLMVRRSDEG
jgi:hypothetical protein